MALDLDTETSSDAAHTAHPDTAHTLPAHTESTDAAPGRVSKAVWIALILVVLLLAAAVLYRLLSRSETEHTLEQTTAAGVLPTVNVTLPTVSGGGSSLSLPGNTQAFIETPIYARTSGYLKQWFVDIGQHVSRGQLMATIQSPEVDQQLQAAKADLSSAQADLNLAQSTARRYQNLLKLDSVSKQETDVAVSGAAAKQAAVDAAQANVRRLQQLVSFEHIYAPFAGVVTVRNTDIGALITAGSSTGAASTEPSPQALFRIADINKLRVFVAIPEIDAPSIHNGDTATITLDEYPGKIFTGTVTRNSSSINPASRTLNVEVDLNNPGDKLLPGAYCTVEFKLPPQARALSIPSNTLVFRAQGTQVGIVRDGHVHLQTISIAKDNGSTLAIATGLSPGDEVILDPSDSLAEGEPVKVTTRPRGTR